MRQSTCYTKQLADYLNGGTTKMKILGVLWHSTGANNAYIHRYVQPDDNDPNREALMALLGKNQYANDWNHAYREAGMNCWVGKLQDGTVSTVQTLPWDFRPWGCGSGKNGSCNSGWIQFEMCEDNLKNADYFNAAYREACEITAYLCKKFGLDPHGSVSYKGVTVPVILCHQDSYRLGLGNDHADIYEWFKRYGKTMVNVRDDVAALMAEPEPVPLTEVIIENAERYIWDDLMGKIGNPYAVAGLMGNLCAESSLNSHDLQGSAEKKLGMTDEQYTQAVNSGTYDNFINDGAGYGLAQWTYYSRKRKLLGYAKERGKSIGDLQMQLDFLWQEMGDSFKAARDALVASQTVLEASNIILTQYEKPADQSAQIQEKRASLGQRYYDRYAEPEPVEELFTVTIQNLTRAQAEEIIVQYGGEISVG